MTGVGRRSLKYQSVSPSFYLSHLVWLGLDLLFPPLCAGCGESGYRWCDSCQRSTTSLGGRLCDACGTLIDGPAALCQDCSRIRPAYRALRSWSGYDGPLRNAILRLKYRGDVALGEALIPQFSQFCVHLGWPIELVIPVPLSRERLRQRGYNQAALLARPLALALGVAYANDALVRVRDTRSQVGLNRMDRQDNVRAAFQGNPKKVDGRLIMLVDDVATTGSTLSSCAEALCSSGARDVFALTAARALPHHVNA